MVNKPAGMLTQPTHQVHESAEELGKEWLRQKYKKPGKVFLHAVQRIDRPVSGIVVCARTSKALSRLNESQRRHQFTKIYHALVEGTLQSTEGVLEHYHRHGSHRAYIAKESSEEFVKTAVLSYRVLEQYDLYTLVEITLQTGRYHQIRAQFAHIGHPIVCDTKYGGTIAWSAGATALHHFQCTFPHPVTREMLSLQAPIPSHWPQIFD